MNETLGSTGMGPEEPVVSSRSGHRNRNVFMLGGLALVLVAGVVFAGVFPTGDRAGTTATDPSASSTPSATATDDPTEEPTPDPSASRSTTATDDPTDDPTPDPSASPSATATDDPTEEPVAVTTCAEGGPCVVGDTGPGGGIVFYVASSPFTCGENLDESCSYLELYTGGTFPGPWCPNHGSWNNEAWGSEAITNNAIGNGAAATVLMKGRCSGPSLDIHNAVLNDVDDWYVPTPLESEQVCTSGMAERVSGYSSRLTVRHWTSNKNGDRNGIYNKTPDCSSGKAAMTQDGNYATWAIRSF